MPSGLKCTKCSFRTQPSQKLPSIFGIVPVKLVWLKNIIPSGLRIYLTEDKKLSGLSQCSKTWDITTTSNEFFLNDILFRYPCFTLRFNFRQCSTAFFDGSIPSAKNPVCVASFKSKPPPVPTSSRCPERAYKIRFLHKKA